MNADSALLAATTYCQEEYGAFGSDDWEESLWRWLRDIAPHALAQLSSELLHFVLATQGVANTVVDTPSGRAVLRVGELYVEVHLATRSMGSRFEFHTRPAMPQTPA